MGVALQSVPASAVPLGPSVGEGWEAVSVVLGLPRTGPVSSDDPGYTVQGFLADVSVFLAKKWPASRKAGGLGECATMTPVARVPDGIAVPKGIRHIAASPADISAKGDYSLRPGS